MQAEDLSRYVSVVELRVDSHYTDGVVSLGTIVESTLVQDICPPSQIADTNWIKPGRVAWSWWSDNPSPQDGAKQMKFVDLAAEMGWLLASKNSPPGVWISG